MNTFWTNIEHNTWMLNNDPNTWAWLLPRDTRIELASQARHGAAEMRKNAYKFKVDTLLLHRTEPTNWFIDSLNRFDPFVRLHLHKIEWEIG